MKILVNEMPKHTSQCPFYDYTPRMRRRCVLDWLPCEIPETKCRWLKEYKPTEDDCK